MLYVSTTVYIGQDEGFISFVVHINIMTMSYKDALESSISDKMTKAQLIAISNALQDQCLLNELDKPALIPFNSYIKDAQSRWDIQHIETRALAKDIHSVGKQARTIYNEAYARAFN